MSISSTIIQIVQDFTNTLTDRTITLDSNRSIQNAPIEIVESLPKLDEDRFQYCEELGKGGMGVVVAAEDTILHREVAIKSLLKKLNPNSVDWKHFYREAQITSQLSHPSIVPVYSFEFTADHQPSLIMKKIKGITLTRFIKECQASQETPHCKEYRRGLLNRIELLIKICDAMHYAHSKGVIHRDIKPDNIMVGDFEDIYVMDWGVACVMNEDLQHLNSTIEIADLGIKTKNGTVVGTLSYMPPEQARGQLNELTYAADQFTIGMILFELLTFKRARKAKTTAEYLERARIGEWNEEHFQEHTKNLDPRLKAIIRKATATDPLDRYPSMQYLAQDLRRFSHNQSVLAYPERFYVRLWRFFTLHPLVLANIISILLIIATTITIFSLRHSLMMEKKLEEDLKISSQMFNILSLDAEMLQDEFVSIEERVEILGSIIETKSRNQHENQDCLLYSALENTSHKIHHPSYGDNWITVEEPVCFFSASKQSATIGLPLANAIQPDIMNAFAGTTDISDVQKYMTEGKTHQILWAYVGFADGTLLNYPGISQFGEAYDPRKRPWYITGKEYTHVTCGEPYPDASGIGYLLPCNRSLRDINDDVFGVVGLDFSLDRVITILENSNFPKIKNRYILNRKGEILFSDADKGQDIERLKKSDHNKAKDKKMFFQPAVLTDIKNEKHHGLIEDDNSIFVFSKLHYVPWTMVYEIDPSIWDCDDCFTTSK